MFQGKDVVGLLKVIMPLYVCIAMGYGCAKFRILPHEENYAGISGFATRFAVPFMVFRMVASSDPYAMNVKLIEADTACKIVILFMLCLGCCYRPSHQHVAWMSSLFNLATMPNSILIGSPLLNSLYPGSANLITTLIFMQCLLWFNVCVLILEIHKAIYENSRDFEIDKLKRQLLESQFTLQAAAGSLSKSVTMLIMNVDTAIQDDPANDLVIQMQQEAAALSLRAAPQPVIKSVALKVSFTRGQVAKRIAHTVMYKFLWSPFAWASFLGFLYSLINFRYYNGKPMPAVLNTLVDMLANCTLPLCMFMLGMNVGTSQNVFTCGIRMALFSAGVRFILGPAMMAVVSYVIGLHGVLFRFAVLQAVVPQAIISFVWASQYNVHKDLFSTAVWFQTATFLPFAIGLDALLNIRS